MDQFGCDDGVHLGLQGVLFSDFVVQMQQKQKIKSMVFAFIVLPYSLLGQVTNN